MKRPGKWQNSNIREKGVVAFLTWNSSHRREKEGNDEKKRIEYFHCGYGMIKANSSDSRKI